jgi:hypothetical protein
MSFWKTLIPDEPFVLDDGVEDTRYLNRLPPAVKGWCLVSILATVFVAAIATAIFQNTGPLLAGAIFALFPSYMLLFWKDISSAAKTAKQRGAERYPLVIQINLSVQWCAISLCVAAPAMAAGLCILLWFTRMPH